MQKLNVYLENCYGIGELKEEFDFSQNNLVLIYAQNGVFKTSFAKTLKDILENKETKDEIFTQRQTKREIKIDEKDITKDNVFIVDSLNENFSSDKSVSTFMASKELKKEYDEIFNILDKSKKELIKKNKKRNREFGLRKRNYENISK